MKKVLAIDMGATSIRGILGYIEDNKLHMEEVMRYNHQILETDGRKHWDLENLMKNIEQAILLTKDEISSIGVDTWGVDFGLFDKDKGLIQEPTSYRDERCIEAYEKIEAQGVFKNLFKKTGNQIMPINSLFQLESMKDYQPEVLEKAKYLLMTPDLINYYLTGNMSGEKTICSTSQMFNLEKGDWNYKVIEEYGFDKGMFPEIVENKIVIGNTKNSLIPSLRDTSIDVVSVASHDTASAVYMTESYTNEKTLFLSSGTWSLMGCYTEEPVLTDEAFDFGLTNETGYNSRNMYFKNITGLYLIEKLISQLEEENKKKYPYDLINELVENTEAFKAKIDIDYEVFALETEDFIKDLDDYLAKTGQEKIDNKEEYFRVIYESMVLNYSNLLKYLEESLDRKFTTIHIIGGGSQSELLCQMIADGLNLEVLAGPQEASALGNILAQLESLYGKDKAKELRKLAEESFELKRYEPINNKEWKNKVDKLEEEK